jgi:hypothetical protein
LKVTRSFQAGSGFASCFFGGAGSPATTSAGGKVGGSADGGCRASLNTAALPQITVTASASAIANFIRVKNMVVNPPSASAATGAETTAPAADPAAKQTAAFTVTCVSPAGTAAVASRDSSVPSSPADSP